MPRSRDVSRYAEEYWDLLEAVSEGKVIDLPFDTPREARSFRSRWYAFTIGIASALRTGCKGLSPVLADRCRKHHLNYGLVAVIEQPFGLRFIHKAYTPEAQRIQAALRKATATAVAPEVAPELAEASAAAILDRLGRAPQAAPTGTVGTASAHGAPQVEEEERADPKVSPIPLGKPNPYY